MNAIEDKGARASAPLMTKKVFDAVIWKIMELPEEERSEPMEKLAEEVVKLPADVRDEAWTAIMDCFNQEWREAIKRATPPASRVKFPPQPRPRRKKSSARYATG
jgi:hypothetical protein